ncbi:MAG: hypothetical protein PHS93_02385 [Candidatus Omnitrophica bacterium]|nr:hypothetical protein [Candidatus Omnitrophota bacterium]MDD5352000.1 hypothetical protein [Candidatus Omnitrophota bacterium]MDD5551054.1 hypothetical protein [Candidatus Omnitrophota bacterium]
MAITDFQSFEKRVEETLDCLFNAARKENEFAYIFSLLGINSGMEDAGWQPITETYSLMRDFVAIANAPFHKHTKARLLLLCYTQITEANYLYHVIYNMLLSIENEISPKVFSFLDLYKNGIPPSVKSKVNIICEKSEKLGYQRIKDLLENIFDYGIRNAISHADYIIYNDELRLKHKGLDIKKIKLDDVFDLVQRTIIFFEVFFKVSDAHKKSYSEGYVISNRKNKKGQNLANIILKVDPAVGVIGFQQSDPLPTW